MCLPFSTASLPQGSEALIAVAVSAGIVITVCVIVIISLFLAFFHSRKSLRLSIDQDSSSNPPRPVYEEITMTKEVINVDRNVAYAQTPGSRKVRANNT